MSAVDATITNDGVAASCGGAEGRHQCLTCHERFPNNITANGHVEMPGDHVMAWWCPEHGMEAPS